MSGKSAEDNQYFAICPACGKIEFFELNEEDQHIEDSTRMNYLKSDGSIAYKNTYVRLKKKDYIDIVCRMCECPVVLIPFDVCDVEERKKVYKMSEKERMKYSERFEILDSLDD